MIPQPDYNTCARWYDPATGRFTQVDPFPGLLSLPGTQHPYVYGLNNPLRYTDPSGEFVGALLGGLAIGMVAGGVSYALQHGGQPIACLLQDPHFWRAVAIGGASGIVSGFVAGFFAPLFLLSSGVGTAMQIGGFIGMLSSFAGHVVTNVLYGRPVAEGLGWAMLSGAVFGALGGALGYWAQQARLSGIKGDFVGYHGTSSQYETAIRRGINPPSGANFRGRAQLGEGFYVTGDRSAAEYFARVATHNAGGKPIVLKVYARNFTTMSGSSVPRNLWWRVPPSYITDYDYLTAPISGLEQWSQIKFNPSVYTFLQATR